VGFRIADHVEPLDRGHGPLLDEGPSGVVVALALVDEAALNTAVGDAQRPVGADGISRLDDPDAIDRPGGFDLDQIDMSPDAA
jgi:hypothetical protein